MHDEPGMGDLIEAVRNFIRDEVSPSLRGRNQFLARVAVNTLEIVARQLQAETEQNARELDRLRGLLGEVANLDNSNRELCARIRNGTIKVDDPRLLDHLWSATLAKLQVDQPKYSTYRAVTDSES